MSKPSHYNTSYRHQDVTSDFSRYGKDDEERRGILPPPAHASSSASFMPSSRSSRKLEGDVSLLSTGVNYSRDSLTFCKPPNDYHLTLDASELPKSIIKTTNQISGRNTLLAKNRSHQDSYGQQLPLSISDTYSKASCIPPNSAHSILSTADPSTSSMPKSYLDGFSVPPPPSSSMSGHSSNPRYTVNNSFKSLGGMTTDMTIWDHRSATATRINTRSSVSPDTPRPQPSSQTFSFSPVPGLLPPLNSSSLSLRTSNNLVSGTANTVSMAALPPSSTFIHSTNNNNIAVGAAIQGPTSSLFTTRSSNNSSPSNSRCATPTSTSIPRCITPPNMFMVPGVIGNTKKSKAMNLAPEINSTTEEISVDTFSSRATTESPIVTTGVVESPSKYNQLLAVLQDMDKDIRPTYAGSKSSTERLKRGIVHTRILIRDVLTEIERSSSRNDSEERPTIVKCPRLQ